VDVAISSSGVVAATKTFVQFDMQVLGYLYCLIPELCSIDELQPVLICACR
jgi:hypothetical protein